MIFPPTPPIPALKKIAPFSVIIIVTYVCEDACAQDMSRPAESVSVCVISGQITLSWQSLVIHSSLS